MSVIHPVHTILVVEDDRAIRETLTDVLELEGHRVMAAEHGVEALAQLERGVLPCIILLDLMMPQMNGWEFRACQQTDPTLASIPVVVMSAFPAGVRTVQELDVTAYLQKPPDLDRLFDVLDRHCAANVAAW